MPYIVERYVRNHRGDESARDTWEFATESEAVKFARTFDLAQSFRREIMGGVGPKRWERVEVVEVIETDADNEYVGTVDEVTYSRDNYARDYPEA